MADSKHTTIDEVWKPVPDFPGYEVSNLGRVRSFWKQKGQGKGKGPVYTIDNNFPHILKQGDNGYLRVVLRKENRPFRQFVHRLVLISFVGPCPAKYWACHNDGNKHNNELSNLRWDTPKNNQHDKISHETIANGSKNGNAKLSESSVNLIRILNKRGISSKELSLKFNISLTNTRDIINYKIWKHI